MEHKIAILCIGLCGKYEYSVICNAGQCGKYEYSVIYNAALNGRMLEFQALVFLKVDMFSQSDKCYLIMAQKH